MTSLNHKCNLHRQQAVNPQPSDKPALPDFYMPAMPPLGLINAIEGLESSSQATATPGL